MLRGVIPVMLNTPECGLTASGPQNIGVEDPMIKYWFPVLFGFYDIIMNGEDLEVRRLWVDMHKMLFAYLSYTVLCFSAH
jgi:brefeldin A-inhibited guanine nucleotide-exchange protein